jgi:hypothetical protein
VTAWYSGEVLGDQELIDLLDFACPTIPTVGPHWIIADILTKLALTPIDPPNPIRLCRPNIFLCPHPHKSAWRIVR